MQRASTSPAKNAIPGIWDQASTPPSNRPPRTRYAAKSETGPLDRCVSREAARTSDFAAAEVRAALSPTGVAEAKAIARRSASPRMPGCPAAWKAIANRSFPLSTDADARRQPIARRGRLPLVPSELLVGVDRDARLSKGAGALVTFGELSFSDVRQPWGERESGRATAGCGEHGIVAGAHYHSSSGEAHNAAEAALSGPPLGAFVPAFTPCRALPRRAMPGALVAWSRLRRAGRGWRRRLPARR